MLLVGKLLYLIMNPLRRKTMALKNYLSFSDIITSWSIYHKEQEVLRNYFSKMQPVITVY